jgi:phage terminase large subunit-like protein
VLEGVLADESLFAFIAHADVDDDWTIEATWRKANPNYAVSVKPGDMASLVTKAIHMPNAAAAFKQKRLNLWGGAVSPWLSLDGWRRGQSAWSAETLAGEACWLGIDLSSKIDLSAIVAAFPPTETRARWRLLLWALTPADTLSERAHRDRAPYDVWRTDGYLRTNPGNRIDQDELRALVTAIAARYRVQQIGIDPWNAGNLENDLTDDGFVVVEIPQTLKHMSAPSKDFEADVLDGLIDAGGNPLMEWCISNAVVERDNKDNIYPVKKRSRGRIDPLIAALMARKLAAADLREPGDVDDPVLVVVGM